MKTGKRWAVLLISLLVVFSLSGGIITASAGEGKTPPAAEGAKPEGVPMAKASSTGDGPAASTGDGPAGTSGESVPAAGATPGTARIGVPGKGEVSSGPAGNGLEMSLTPTLPSVECWECPKKGSITVVKFLDENGDGVRQAGEPGMSDVLVKLGTSSQAYTGPDGTAVFSKLADGTYAVSEVVPAGYEPTTPTSHEVIIKHGCQVTVFFGNRPLPPAPGKICGRKWEDYNADGIRQEGEPPVPGVKVELWRDGSRLVETETGPDGSYSFEGLQPGDYTVRELPGTEWVPTQPAERQVTVTAGQEVRVEFLNARKPAVNCDNGIVEVIVREDLDWDGMADMEEPLLSGIRVELYRKVGGDWIPADGHDGPYAKVTGPGAYGMLYIFGIPMPPYPGGWAGWAHLPRSDGPSGYTEYAVKVLVPEGFQATEATWYEGLILRCPLPCWWRQVVIPLARCGSISGAKYEDWDGNGAIDPTDPPIEGVTVRLYQGTTLVAETVTGPDGSYHFTGLKPGTYRVVEVLPTGSSWEPVLPPGGSHEVTLAYGEARTGLDFLNRRPCSLRGRKWEDRNYDGRVDDGDLPVPGVTVELWRDGSKVAQAVTAEDGSYTFEDLAPGAYTVKEVLESPWEPVEPASGAREVSLEPGQALEGLDFLNARYGSIAGIKFHDADQDGLMDEGEEGIDGVTVILEPGPLATETAGGGRFSFEHLKAGTYQIRVDEDSLPGYFPTGPSSVEVLLGHGQRVFLYFGNAPYGSITGHKWLDEDMDGSWDPEETRTLAGITIEVYAGYPPTGDPMATAVTGEDGSYSFAGLLPGTYTVVERPAAGMFPTTQAQVRVEVTSGMGVVVDFGNCPYGMVQGLKFQDLDGDGVRDDTEPGLAGVTITLESVSGDGPILAAVTGEDGSFSFTGLAPGRYRVGESVPPGYYATRPVSVEVDLRAGDTASVLFANAPYASVAGHKWQDNNGDGVRDPGEPPVGGITVVLTGYTLSDERVEMQASTADDGSYSFLLLEAGNYTVYEVMPSNMEATTTDRYDLWLRPGDRVTDLDFFNALVQAGGEVVPPPTPGPGPVTPPTQPPVQVAPELVRGQLPATGASLWLPPLIAALLILAGYLLLAAGMRRT